MAGHLEDHISMKLILNVVALSAVIALMGCHHNKTSANMGAVDEKSGCCSGKSSGCCKDKSSTSADKANSTNSTDSTNMGAMDDSTKKTGCCAAHAASGCPHATQSNTSGN